MRMSRKLPTQATCGSTGMNGDQDANSILQDSMKNAHVPFVSYRYLLAGISSPSRFICGRCSATGSGKETNRRIIRPQRRDAVGIITWKLQGVVVGLTGMAGPRGSFCACQAPMPPAFGREDVLNCLRDSIFFTRAKGQRGQCFSRSSTTHQAGWCMDRMRLMCDPRIVMAVAARLLPTPFSPPPSSPVRRKRR